ncbi:MAG: EAL domain-containing response regulator [Burkholderiaceae bacterium]
MLETKRLLILDDDQDVAKIISLVAGKLGFSVAQCTEAEQFFEYVEHWKPSYIALDLVMPDMDGIEVLRRLAGKEMSAQIILTSGIGTKVLEAARQSAKNYGLSIVGILPKPFRASMLRDMLLQPDIDLLLGKDAASSVEISAIEISRALKNDEFEIYYQPKLDLLSKKVVAFEALVRWNHPVKGMLGPDSFIPLVEAGAQIEELTYKVIEQGMRWLQSLRSDGGNPLMLQFNISPSLLHEIGMVDKLAAMCRNFDLEPSAISFEITESSPISEFTPAVEILARLRIKGFELAIDDFGTGYSSIAQLSKLPFTELKIDKSFVRALHQSSDARNIVKHTIELAKNLGLHCVAEGVEDAATVRYLEEAGCDWVQGYYIGRPMPGKESAAWLQGHA